jgi:hypothetical protein
MASGDVLELAAVTRFSLCRTWKPKTKFRGCRVYEESNRLELLTLDKVVRGALMCPAFGAPRNSIHYLWDLASDSDMFLRLNNLSVPLDV